MEYSHLSKMKLNTTAYTLSSGETKNTRTTEIFKITYVCSFCEQDNHGKHGNEQQLSIFHSFASQQ